MRAMIDDRFLEQVNGGVWMHDPGFLYQMRFTFKDEEVAVLAEHGIHVHSGIMYSRGELNDIGLYGHSGLAVKEELEQMGLTVTEEMYR